MASHTMTQGYSFTAQPEAVHTRSRYRQEGQQGGRPAQPMNIMFDPRVIRGSTYAAHVLPANAQPDPLELARQAEARRRRRVKRQKRALARAPRTPPAVEGRQHVDIQTELYLEEITEQPIEKDVEVQTDQFLDRPPSPVFVPKKLGVDATTQIYPGDLFAFDVEVQPILEVIVGKTLQQALMEVMEEEELANMRAHQREFHRLRDAELAETQRLEEAERRRHEEKERRMQQERVRLQLEKEAREKIAARAFAKSYLSDLMGGVFTSLKDAGYFFDTIRRDVETGFLPSLMARVGTNLERHHTARRLTDMLLSTATNKRLLVAQAHQLALKQEQERLARIAAEEAARKAEEEARIKAELEAAAAAQAAADDSLADGITEDEYGDYDVTDDEYGDYE